MPVRIDWQCLMVAVLVMTASQTWPSLASTVAVGHVSVTFVAESVALAGGQVPFVDGWAVLGVGEAAFVGEHEEEEGGTRRTRSSA